MDPALPIFNIWQVVPLSNPPSMIKTRSQRWKPSTQRNPFIMRLLWAKYPPRSHINENGAKWLHSVPPTTIADLFERAKVE
jgi:hypothetical protein